MHASKHSLDKFDQKNLTAYEFSSIGPNQVYGKKINYLHKISHKRVSVVWYIEV